jgi:hypothetical protein
VTSVNAGRVTSEFEKYFRENNNNPAAQYKTYVVKGSNDPDKLQALTAWMDTHAIRYGQSSTTKTTRGFNYQSQAVSQVNISHDDLIISIYQPKSRFITTIFEPAPRLSDSLTYDITAWNLIYSYNLEAYALPERINATRPFQKRTIATRRADEKPYDYIFKYSNLRDVSFLAALIQNNIRVRSAAKTFAINGHTFPPGSLIITRRNNEDISSFDNTVLGLAKDFEREAHTVKTGFVDQGKDLGSGDLRFIKPPEVAVLFGEQTSALSSGEIWHFFEQQIKFPITQIGSKYFKGTNLEKYDVLIIPEGTYTLFDEPTLDHVTAWVREGGRLIIIGNALNSFVDKKGFQLKKYGTEAEKSEAEQLEKQEQEREGFPRFEELERKQLSEKISGAIYRVSLDNSHPLAFGLKPFYYTLKNHERRFAWLGEGWNVGIFKGPTKPVQGFAGYKANRGLGNSLLVGVEDVGQGRVVYFVDNPLFRSFWEDGKMLFANSVFIVGQ